MNDMRIFNNQALQKDEEVERFHNAFEEIKEIMPDKEGRYPVGTVIRRYGYVFERSRAEEWILRPNDYLGPAEVMERYPTEEERKSYYVWYNSKIRIPSF